MLVKYCVADEICLTELCDVTFDNGLLRMAPMLVDYLPIIVEHLSLLDAKIILEKLYNYGKVDLTMYKDDTYYDDGEDD